MLFQFLHKLRRVTCVYIVTVSYKPYGEVHVCNYSFLHTISRCTCVLLKFLTHLADFCDGIIKLFVPTHLIPPYSWGRGTMVMILSKEAVILHEQKYKFNLFCTTPSVVCNGLITCVNMFIQFNVLL